MKKIDLNEILENNVRNYKNYNQLFKSIIIGSLNLILKVGKINSFLDKHQNKKNIDFLDDIFEHLDYSFYVSDKNKNKIPAEGKLIIVSNHPLGGLDGLALLKLVYQVRKDVKIVANDVLMQLENLNEFFIPYSTFNKTLAKASLLEIHKRLENEEAIIIFPAGEVSRYKINGIKDKKWTTGAVKFAEKFSAPILPVHIKGRNSYLFYFLSTINKKLSTFLLPREIFNKKGKSLVIKIGNPIAKDAFAKMHINFNEKTKLLRKHTNQIKKNIIKGILPTEKNIIHPIDSKIIKLELSQSEVLGFASDSKIIYLVDGSKSNVIKEIARLREVTFRKVGEGTGNKQDSDNYDTYYKHIVLWDEKRLDIIGSYRIGICKDIIENYGIRGLYNSVEFSFSDEFKEILESSVEMGRSFIQQKYWKSNALDQLWQGIGSYLSKNPEIKYLFGAVSISDSYSEFAKSLIVGFYTKWHKDNSELSSAKTKFIISKSMQSDVNEILNSANYQEDFINLKKTLKNIGYSVPVLFKRYSELCEQDGVKFIDFGVDEAFSNVVDGLILLDLSRMKENYKERYYYSKISDYA